jgi:hypothetical protein
MAIWHLRFNSSSEEMWVGFYAFRSDYDQQRPHSLADIACMDDQFGALKSLHDFGTHRP